MKSDNSEREEKWRAFLKEAHDSLDEIDRHVRSTWKPKPLFEHREATQSIREAVNAFEEWLVESRRVMPRL